MKRRDLLIAMAAIATCPTVASCTTKDVPASKRSPGDIGVQLYTVRDRMAVDVPDTLRRVAEIGYREVEFAGYFDHSAAEIAAMLVDAGLASPSTHVGMGSMRDTPGQLIDATATIGHEYIVLGSPERGERSSLDDFRRHADLMNRFGEQCQTAGLRFAYHNHAFEFEPLDDVLPMDLLLERTDPELVDFELDLYWIRKGGADPFTYFDKHPGRFPLCHVKDMAEDGSMTDVGSGQTNFSAIFAASEQAGFRHYFVEHDNPADSMASVANSFSAIQQLFHPDPTQSGS